MNKKCIRLHKEVYKKYPFELDNPNEKYKIIIANNTYGYYSSRLSYGFFAEPFFAQFPELEGRIKQFDHIKMIITDKPYEPKVSRYEVSEDGELEWITYVPIMFEVRKL